MPPMRWESDHVSCFLELCRGISKHLQGAFPAEEDDGCVQDGAVLDSLKVHVAMGRNAPVGVCLIQNVPRNKRDLVAPVLLG